MTREIAVPPSPYTPWFDRPSNHDGAAEPNLRNKYRQATNEIEVVGNCPDCGQPIYGKREVVVGAPITTQRTCYCPPKTAQKDIRDSMETK